MKTVKIKATLAFEVPNDEQFDVRQVVLRWTKPDEYAEDGLDVALEDVEEIHETVQSTDKQKAFIVTLTGQGDTMFYLVNEETFNFINDGGRAPDDVVKAYGENYLQFDGEEPMTEADFREELEGFTGTSPDNDRALAISGTEFNGETCYLDSVNIKKANTFALKHNLEIQEESYEGCIY
jgi:hypothetical protein